jgi:hypothetical protein
MQRLWILVAVWISCHAGPLVADEPFDYFRNSWSVVGLKDYLDAARISPENQILLGQGQKLTISFGRQLTPLSRRQTKTLKDGWLPIVLLTARDEEVRYDFAIWAAPLPSVKDWKAAFHGPAEGENFLVWIRVDATNLGDTLAEARVHARRTGSKTGKPVSWDGKLAPGESNQHVVCIPFTEMENERLEDTSAQLWYRRTASFWTQLLSGAAQVETPDTRANDALRASHVYQFINNDHGVVQGGEGFYDVFYIRDGAYEVQQFEEAGLLDAARRSMEAFLEAQRSDGRFESQQGQLDANGQALWALWQFYKITGDRPWLEATFPAMVRATDWIIQTRRETSSDPLFAGVLPNAVADGEYLWDGEHHIVGYDFWNLRGMLCTADAARTLGKTAFADRLEREAEQYRTAIDAAWQRTALPFFPPSWEKVGTHWGNTETLWPTPLFAEDDPRVTALINEVRNEFGGGFHEGTIRWLPGSARDAIHPYMSSYTTMASLQQGQHEQVVEDFYWYLLHSTAAHAFPEGIYYRQRIAWHDTIPHATGASNYAFLLRHMLIHEKGDELHLLPGVPDWWLGDGQTIRVERAPTHFGEMDLFVRGRGDGVEVRLRRPAREPPQQIVVHLPQSRPAKVLPADVKAVMREDQSRRWDLSAVIEAYERIRPQPIPGLLPLPPDQLPVGEKCQFLDLRPLTNTDPFAAPFGVPRPGKFLFTGMPVGDQVVAGIPFRILDPADNAGRALVVLQGGPSGGAADGFPREVELRVSDVGKRIFLLGNVVGWSGRDGGVGDSHVVAEYVIEYSDGHEQTIPWILGRTTDDWAVSPMADQALAGLRGDPWHLNVVAAPLRPVSLRRILFRDRGTVSAPVLVAVTIER